jgi:hypothetical protein
VDAERDIPEREAERLIPPIPPAAREAEEEEAMLAAAAEEEPIPEAARAEREEDMPEAAEGGTRLGEREGWRGKGEGRKTAREGG